MILVDGEKYACVQCIRGHRSSTCKHSQRPLVQVRSRGRPSLNAGHRIAVTESQLELSRDQVTIQDSNGNVTNGSDKSKVKDSVKQKTKSPEPQTEPVKSCCSSKTKTKTPEPEEVPKSSCCSSKKPTSPLPTPPAQSSTTSTESPTKSSCCSSATHANCNCGKNGVIMLKASKRQFVDVKNGTIDYVGPYNESSLSKFKIASLQKSLNRHKHTRNSSCCSQNPTSNQIRKKLKVLKTLKMNEIDYQVPRDQLLGLQFPLAPATAQTHQQQQQQIHPQPSNQLQHQQQHYYQRQQNDTGDHHSSDRYQKDLSALGLPMELSQAQQFNSHASQQFDQALKEYQQLQQQNQQQQQQTGTVPQHQPQQKLYDVVLSSGCDSECHCGPDCDCPGCLIHRTNEELREYGILDTSPASTPSESQALPSAESGIFSNTNNGNNGQFKLAQPLNYDLINLETIDELLQNNYMFEDECYCEALECRCFNCPKHDIIDGIRQTDGKRVSYGDGNSPAALAPGNISSNGSEYNGISHEG